MQLKHIPIFLLAGATAILSSCSKSNDSTNISTGTQDKGQTVSDSVPLTGAIKGVMGTGKTYTIDGDVTINAGDTLTIQEGVKVYMDQGADIIVKGTLLSLGTKDKPNWITVKGVTKEDNAGQDPSTDPAYAGMWDGINCDTSCNLLVIKWTHIEFGGGAFTTPPISGTKSGDNSFVIFFQNEHGVFDMEDSWVYGSIDDPIRIAGGKINLMRNTFEKCGYTGGDVMNAKGGTVGNMAYNLVIGSATTGTKASNKHGTDIQCNVDMYNNTYLNSGFRRLESGRGGSVNYEEGAKGEAYNNLIVDCRFGFRVVNDPEADTANMKYGYTWNYGDSASITDEFYPTGYITIPQSTDVPKPSTFLPTAYQPGDIYDGSSLVGKNDPKFVDYPLPQPQYEKISAVGSYNFHLASGSPCIGQGYTGFTPLQVVPVDPMYGATEITPPGKDMGAYQMDGSGNQH